MVRSSSTSLDLLKVVCCLVMTVIAQSYGLSVTDCQKTKGCLFYPEGCFWDQGNNTCMIGVTFYRTNDNKINFELIARQAPPSSSVNEAKYVALGFSADQMMGNEPVVACIFSTGGQQAGVYMSYNSANKSNSAMDQSYSKYVQLNESSTQNGLLYCRFTMTVSVNETMLTTTYRSLNNSFYLLLASGMADPNTNTLRMHSTNRTDVWYPTVTRNVAVSSSDYSKPTTDSGKGGNGAIALVQTNGFNLSMLVAVAVLFIQQLI